MSRQILLALSTMWASRSASIVANLVLLPVLFHHLSGDALGTWLLLGQAAAFMGFMDFGISNVLVRRIAFASVPQTGDGPGTRDARLAELVATAKPLYCFATALAFAVGLCGGWAFLGRVSLSDGMLASARVAWAVLCVGQAVSLSGGLWSAALVGLGSVSAAAVLASLSGLLTLTALAITVLSGGGIESLAVVVLIGNVVQRWATLRVLGRREPLLLALRGRWDRSMLGALLVPALKYWLTEIGAVLLLRTDQFFIAGFQNPAQIPSYYAGYTLMYNIAVVSMAAGDASFVYVSRLWGEGRLGEARALVVRSARIGLALILTGAAVMASIGDAVIAVWLGPGHFVGRPVFLTFCVMVALFVQQSLMFGFSRATEHEVYAPCYLAAGALNIVITWVLVGPLGLLGVALGTLSAQMLTTNWYVPVVGLRRLRIAWRSYAAQVLLPAGGAAGLTYGAVWWATHGIAGGRSVERVLVGSMVGAVAMGAGFWALIFDAEMRDQVGRRMALLVRRLRRPATS